MEHGLKESEGKVMVGEVWARFQWYMAEAMTKSKSKYPPKNWMKPMEDPLELFNGLERHVLQVKIALQEQDPGLLVDPDDGVDHLVKIANNCSMLQYQLENFYKFNVKDTYQVPSESIPALEVALKCPICKASEVESETSYTYYECGSFDYDQRPGTFVQAERCHINQNLPFLE